jgi:hypothetical protein
MFFEIAGIILASGAVGALLASLFTQVVNMSKIEEEEAAAIPRRSNKQYSILFTTSRAHDRIEKHPMWRQSLGTIHEE